MLGLRLGPSANCTFIFRPGFPVVWWGGVSGFEKPGKLKESLEHQENINSYK